MNEIEIKSFFASANADASLLIAAENYPNLKIVLTKGVKGSVYKDSENYIYQPSFKAQAVDTTAAGDTFMGYFVAGLYNEMPIGEILKTASAASAMLYHATALRRQFRMPMRFIQGSAKWKKT